MKQIAQVNVQRIKALANLLDDVQENRFDLEAWQKQPYTPATKALFGLIQTAPECGFSGCAMGWAAHANLFPGFALLQAAGGYAYVVYRNERGTYQHWEAVMEVLGISRRMAHRLFHQYAYSTRPTTGMVAARLRRFATKIEEIRARDRRRSAPVQKSDRVRELMESVS